MNRVILAQIFGLLGALSMLLSNWQKTRSKVLTFLLFDCFFYFIQYILLGAISGAFTNIVGLLRTIIFKYKDRYKILKSNIILLVILIIYLLIGVFTYNGTASIFPVVASILYSVVLWLDDVRKIRVGTALMILSWFLYNLTVEAYLSAIVEGILFMSSFIAIVKLDVLKNKNIVQIN